MAAQTLDAKELAKRFIQPYVERGSADSFLRDMGSFSNGVGIVIGGYCNGKRVTNNQIAVEIGETVSIFNKKDIIDELRHGQLRLL